MSIEIERKFIVDEAESDKLKKRSIKKIGIIQWYLKSEENEIERVRLQLIRENGEIIEKWNYAYKANTNIPHVKIENEKDYVTKNIDDLFNKKMVVKIRYIIKENPEIVLDEFVEFEYLHYNINEKYLLEIEMKEIKEYNTEDFLNELKKENIKIIKDVTEDYKYYNNNIATKSEKDLKLKEILEVLKWKI
jgi:CYTH domain-containing protein